MFERINLSKLIFLPMLGFPCSCGFIIHELQKGHPEPEYNYSCEDTAYDISVEEFPFVGLEYFIEQINENSACYWYESYTSEIKLNEEAFSLFFEINDELTINRKDYSLGNNCNTEVLVPLLLTIFQDDQIFTNKMSVLFWDSPSYFPQRGLSFSQIENFQIIHPYLIDAPICLEKEASVKVDGSLWENYSQVSEILISFEFPECEYDIRPIDQSAFKPVIRCTAGE